MHPIVFSANMAVIALGDECALSPEEAERERTVEIWNLAMTLKAKRHNVGIRKDDPSRWREGWKQVDDEVIRFETFKERVFFIGQQQTKKKLVQVSEQKLQVNLGEFYGIPYSIIYQFNAAKCTYHWSFLTYLVNGVGPDITKLANTKLAHDIARLDILLSGEITRQLSNTVPELVKIIRDIQELNAVTVSTVSA